MEVRVWHIPVVALAALVLLFGLTFMPSGTGEAAVNSDGLTYNSMVLVYQNGELIHKDSNTLTNIGKELIEDWINSANGSYITRLSLGNTTAPAVGDKAHPGEFPNESCALGVHTVSAWTDIGTGNESTTYEWTCKLDNSKFSKQNCSGGIVVNTTGLTTNHLQYFAGTDFTDVTLQNNDKLNITWYTWVT